MTTQGRLCLLISAGSKCNVMLKAGNNGKLPTSTQQLVVIGWILRLLLQASEKSDIKSCTASVKFTPVATAHILTAQHSTHRSPPLTSAYALLVMVCAADVNLPITAVMITRRGRHAAITRVMSQPRENAMMKPATPQNNAEQEA
jgi:hypothetical protein